jgi:hypothetical protein
MMDVKNVSAGGLAGALVMAGLLRVAGRSLSVVPILGGGLVVAVATAILTRPKPQPDSNPTAAGHPPAAVPQNAAGATLPEGSPPAERTLEDIVAEHSRLSQWVLRGDEPYVILGEDGQRIIPVAQNARRLMETSPLDWQELEEPIDREKIVEALRVFPEMRERQLVRAFRAYAVAHAFLHERIQLNGHVLPDEIPFDYKGDELTALFAAKTRQFQPHQHKFAIRLPQDGYMEYEVTADGLNIKNGSHYTGLDPVDRWLDTSLQLGPGANRCAATINWTPTSFELKKCSAQQKTLLGEGIRPRVSNYLMNLTNHRFSPVEEDYCRLLGDLEPEPAPDADHSGREPAAIAAHQERLDRLLGYCNDLWKESAPTPA